MHPLIGILLIASGIVLLGWALIGAYAWLRWTWETLTAPPAPRNVFEPACYTEGRLSQ